MARRAKEVRELLDAAVRSGFTWDTTTKGHYRVRNPQRVVVAITAGTASDHRGLKNFRADLRRGGVVGL